MSLPTKGETFAKLMENLRYAQENAATLAHLNADESKLIAQGWMAVSEMFKLVQRQVMNLATKGTIH